MKLYTKPVLSVTRFEAENVLMTSGVSYTTAEAQKQYLEDNGLVLESTVGNDGEVLAGAYFYE